MSRDLFSGECKGFAQLKMEGHHARAAIAALKARPRKDRPFVSHSMMARSGAAADTMDTAAATVIPAKAGYYKLAGTKGMLATVGEISEVGDGNVCWTLHPAYAAWFWPLMLKATSLALLVPESLLEPASADDSTIAPRPPTEEEKSAILKAPEREQDAVRVYSLVLKGKQPSVRKAFPTRTVSLAALRYCRVRINADPKTPSA